MNVLYIIYCKIYNYNQLYTLICDFAGCSIIYLHVYTCIGVLKIGDPPSHHGFSIPKWSSMTWMIWEYPHFRNFRKPYINDYIYIYIRLSSYNVI